jgi:hypothetical protein
VDEILIARYLAGACDEGERQHVEKAARSSPEIRECIDIAREALLSNAPEKATPATATAPPQVAFDRLHHRKLPAAILKWAVAASLLVGLAGAGFLLARTQMESVEVLAAATSELGNLQKRQQETVRQLRKDKEDRLAELGKQYRLAAKAEADANERKMELIRSQVTKTFEQQNAMLQKMQDEFATQQKASRDDFAKQYAALRDTCGKCQSSRTNETACTACRTPSAQPTTSPCLCQPSPCVVVPAPCASTYPVACQSAATFYVAPLAKVMSYGPADGWRFAQPAAHVPAAVTPLAELPCASTTSSNTTVSTASGASLRATAQRQNAVVLATSPVSNIVPAVRSVAPDSHVVARPIVQAASPSNPSAPPQPVQGATVIVDDGGWHAPRD